jgi:hypothetical protein
VSNSKEVKARAEALFKRKEEQARQGAIALAEYEAQRRAVAEKTERLRALRLAKEEVKPPTRATRSRALASKQSVLAQTERVRSTYE